MRKAVRQNELPIKVENSPTRKSIKKTKRISYRERSLSEFPGSKAWGVLGSVGGTWASTKDWKCPVCGSLERLVVWGEGRSLIYCDCIKCWGSDRHTEQQLDLFNP